MPLRSYLGAGALGGALALGGAAYPVELGHLALGGSYLGGRHGGAGNVLVNAGLARVTVSAAGAGGSVPEAVAAPNRGYLGRGPMGATYLGGTPGPFALGHGFAGQALLGGWPPSPAATSSVTATAGLAQVTVTAAGATGQLSTGDAVYFWGTYGDLTNVLAQFNSPTQVPNLGSEGTPTPLGAVASIDAENGWVTAIITATGLPWGTGANEDSVPNINNNLSQTTTPGYGYPASSQPNPTPLASPSDVTPSSPFSTNGASLPILEINGGDLFGVARDSAGQVFAWGNNNVNQLGNTSATNPQKVPLLVEGIGGSGNLAVATGTAGGGISAGGGTVAALLASGQVVCWGDDSFGQCGQNTHGGTYSTPVKVLTGAQGDVSGFLSHIVAVSVGHTHCLALDSSGNVWAWGQNQFGQLGGGPTLTANFYATPIAVDAVWGPATICQISAGGGTANDGHSLFVDNSQSSSTGILWAAGGNFYDQLGISANHGTNTPVYTPHAVQQLGGNFLASLASAGGRHSMAVDLSGELWAWGDNTQGCLGTGTGTGKTYVPQAVPLPVGTSVNLMYAGNATSIVDLQVGSNNVTAHAGLAQVTVDGLGATAQTGGNVTATAGLAQVTVDGLGATAQTGGNVTATAGLAQVTVEGLGATAVIPSHVIANAGLAQVTVRGRPLANSGPVTAHAALATVTVKALGANQSSSWRQSRWRSGSSTPGPSLRRGRRQNRK